MITFQRLVSVLSMLSYLHPAKLGCDHLPSQSVDENQTNAFHVCAVIFLSLCMRDKYMTAGREVMIASIERTFADRSYTAITSQEVF